MVPWPSSFLGLHPCVDVLKLGDHWSQSHVSSQDLGSNVCCLSFRVKFYFLALFVEFSSTAWNCLCLKYRYFLASYERNNSYYFCWANQQKAGTQIYSLAQCSLSVNGCDWHILAGNDERINSHCLTRDQFETMYIYVVVEVGGSTHSTPRYRLIHACQSYVACYETKLSLFSW